MDDRSSRETSLATSRASARATRAAVAPLLVGLVLLLVVGSYSLSSTSHVADLVEHTREVSLALAELQQLMVDAETGERGYLVTRDAQFRGPYDLALARWRDQLRLVTDMTQDDPAQRENIRRLTSLIDAEIDEMAITMRLGESGASPEQLSTAMLRGKNGMDAIRRSIAELQAEEQRLSLDRQARASAQSRWTIVLFGGSIVVLVLILTRALLRRRDEIVRTKRAEEQASLFEQAPTGIVVVDRRGRIVSVNAHAERLFGYSRGELLGASVETLVPKRVRREHPELRDAFTREPRARPMGGGRDLRGVRKDGSEVPIEIGLSPLRSAEGTVVVASIVDISERKRAEEAADAERRLLRAVLAGIEDGFTVQDRTGKLLFANESGARLVGFASPEEMMATPAAEILRRFEVFGEDGAPFPLERLPSRAVLMGEPGEPVVVRHRVVGTREERWSHVRAYPVHDAEGRLARVINVFRDITAEHRDEAQRRLLSRAVERLNSSLHYEETLAAIGKEIVPTIADWCAVDLLEGDELRRVALAHVDPGKRSLVEEIERRHPSDPHAPGSPREVMKSGKPFLLSTIPDEMLHAAARDAEHRAMIEALCLRSILVVPMIGRRGPLGALTFATAESRRTYSEDDVAFASALADRAAIAIENAKLVRELETTVARETSARAEAEQATRFSELFVGMLGHDLRNPLSSIATGAQLVLLMAEDERVRRPASRIVTSAMRMGRMIEQLLDLTRIRLGKGLPLEPREMSLEDLARQIVEETEAAHPCSIKIECVGDTFGVWDGDRLGQVLSNLLANAAVHGTTSHEIEVRLDGSAPVTMRMNIRNDGEIPADVLPDLFEPFRRSRHQRGRARGLGLGLYITREIVHAHRGSIEVACERGGTTFDIQLPRLPRVAPQGN